MKKILPYLDKAVNHFAYTLFVAILLCVLLAFFKSTDNAEASMGDFSCVPYNEGWTVIFNGEMSNVTLPTILPAKFGDIITIKNTLPNNLSEGMSLMLRTYMEDAYVYIDEKPIDSYATKNFRKMTKYLPSEYVVVPISPSDAGKEIRIEYTVKYQGMLNEIQISHGNNVWFGIIKDNIILVVISLFAAIVGLAVILFFLFFKNKMPLNRSILYLGMLSTMMGTWILSESKLRQLIFRQPSMSFLFSYLSLEIIGILVCLYFDEVQHHKHHKIYILLDIVITLQISLNIALHFAKVAEFQETLTFSHVWLILGIIIIAACIISDIKSHYIKTYKVISGGMAIFIFLCVCEILSFYFDKYRSLGTFICPGILFLLLSTILQMIFDEAKQIHLREKVQQESWISTIETIASAIDAKDEYTGGHSNRVGEYAGILAREMAADYDLSEEDILRIRYIGLMHDIGKIGVADPILNKAGKLTDEEFTLMKKHAEIGYDLMKPMKGNMEGLLDGIRYHHERFDGHGYPDGLEGTDIPLIARILCLADCYDAMTSNRVYRRRLSDEEVRNEIVRCAGTQFDPALADIFVKAIDNGNMKPSTINGMAVDNQGTVLKSALLEEKLQKDTSINHETVLNPAHIRMISYIIKLAEQDKRSFEVLFAEIKEPVFSERNSEKTDCNIEQILKPYIHTKDINVKYTKNTNIVVLFNRTGEELKNIISELSKDVALTLVNGSD